MRGAAVATLATTAAALALGVTPAGAHGGDAAKIHGCVVGGNGRLEIVGPNDACKKNDTALDWPAVATTTSTPVTYAAGFGLALSPGNVFSVTGAPWGGLTGVPADLLDGDDDGSAAVAALKSQLALEDSQPNEPTDLVSFSQIKHLANRITSGYIEDGTIRTHDLAGSDASAVPGSVTSDKILDGSIQGRDLGNVVQTVGDTLDPPSVPAGTRAAVTMTSPFLGAVKPSDLVTVSPPASLEPGLLFAGSDVLTAGEVTIYLHNISAAAIDPAAQSWKVRYLDTDG